MEDETVCLNNRKYFANVEINSDKNFTINFEHIFEKEIDQNYKFGQCA